MSIDKMNLQLEELRVELRVYPVDRTSAIIETLVKDGLIDTGASDMLLEVLTSVDPESTEQDVAPRDPSERPVLLEDDEELVCLLDTTPRTQASVVDGSTLPTSFLELTKGLIRERAYLYIAEEFDSVAAAPLGISERMMQEFGWTNQLRIRERNAVAAVIDDYVVELSAI